jgi:hypothetical protein
VRFVAGDGCGTMFAFGFGGLRDGFEERLAF